MAKEKSYQIILAVSIFINIVFILILLLSIIGNLYFDDTIWCDYDSCSQETYKWNYNGSSCFDSNNPDCREFLMLWNACQEYKNKIGVC